MVSAAYALSMILVSEFLFHNLYVYLDQVSELSTYCFFDEGILPFLPIIFCLNCCPPFHDLRDLVKLCTSINLLLL